MAANVELATRDEVFALPDGIALPGSQDLEVALVSATFDGSAAAASFYPCLALYSQSGHLLGRFFPSQAMAAGDSGEVTFGPFLEQPAAATPAGGSSIQTLALVVSGFALSGGGFDLIAFTGTSFSNNDGTTMTLNGSGNLEVAGPGVYGLHLKASALPATPAGSSSNLQLSFDVIAGSVQLWSSKGVGMALEGNARWGTVLDDGAGRAIDAQGPQDLFALFALRATATFPVEIGAYTTFQINNIDQVGTADYKLTCVRFGDLFV